MTDMQLLEALTGIDHRYILSAQEKLGYSDAASRPRNSLRSRWVLISAVILLLAATFTTAMAVSPEFRDAVFTFLGITDPEIIPEMEPNESNPGMEVEEGRIIIGGVIEGTYIHFPNMSAARHGVFTVCTDDVQMNSGSHYDAYYEESGEFIRLEEHTFSQVYHLFENEIHVEFDWVEYNGNVISTFVESEAPFVKFGGAGDVAATLMWLQIDPPGDEEFGYYPVLINVRTGELTDICAGLGVEYLKHIRQAAISDDLTQMLIVDWDENIYYADLVGRKLYAMNDLLTQRCAACALVDGMLVAWSENYGTYTVRVFDTNTWESRETYSGRPEFISGFDASIHAGNIYRGTRFAIEVDANQGVYVIDLTTGERSVIEGFQWQQEDSVFTECVPSADGNKLLIYSRGPATYYHSIGVLDFCNRTYIAFSRENAGSVNEHSAYWFDNNSIIIETSDISNSRYYYVYRLLP